LLSAVVERCRKQAVVGIRGACWEGTVEVFISWSELFLLPPVVEINKTDIMQSMPNTEAKIHVPFPVHRLVCFTPMNWLLKPAMCAAQATALWILYQDNQPKIMLIIAISMNKTIVIT
jgi:hypothetical protein